MDISAQYSNWVRQGIFFLGLILAIMALPAHAQQIKPLDVEQDPNGVDWLSGKASPRVPTLSIPAAPNLAFQKLPDFVPLLEGSYTGSPDGHGYSIMAGAIASDGIQCDNGGCTAVKGTGAVFFGHPTSSVLHYIQGGTGKRVRFDVRTKLQGAIYGTNKFYYLASTVTFPDGEVLTFAYDEYTTSYLGQQYKDHRVASVTSTLGYRLEFAYQSNTYDTGWTTLSSAQIVKTSSPSIPLVKFTYTDTSVTDLLGRTWNCTNCRNWMGGPKPESSTSLTLPGDSVASYAATGLVIDHSGPAGPHDEYVTDVDADGVHYDYTWTEYSGVVPYPTDALMITGPAGFSRTVDTEVFVQGSDGCFGGGACSFSIERQRVKSVTDSQGRLTQYEHDNASRVRKITYPELNFVSVEYDISGNITSLTQTPKPGSSLSATTQTAFYNSGYECDAITCFKPVWTRDALNRQTDYTWATHGGMLSQLDPADAQGKRRKVKNTYTTTAPFRVTKEEVCEADTAGTEVTCGLASSFVKEWTYFGSTSLPTSETITDGAGNGPLTTTFTYDDAGRLLVSDGPLTGSDDATYFRYDAVGRKIWEVGPKGENGLRPASKTTYRDADDQVTRVDSGTVPGDTTHINPVAEPVLADVISVTTDYDTRRLPRAIATWAGGSRKTLTNINYDSRNRENCTAVRLNNAGAWGACTPQEGAEGFDRVTRKHYDSESRVTRIEQGVGTTLVRNYATYTFTPNGQMASMTDARGYKATMLYDGFDRQTHWYFPQPGQTGSENPNDYELYTYDANGNRTSLRKRDGSVLSFTYDNLNRVTRKTVPERAGLDATHTRDVFYRYDIRGLQERARFDTQAGEGESSTYDRYGRVASATTSLDGVSRVLNYTYDNAGNRLSLRFPDAKFLYYTYGSGGQFNEIKDHASAVIANYNYNTRGELSQVDRDSTAPDQDWTYDTMGRLASTGWSNAGTSNVTWSFTRNRASQITSETQSSDAYSWNAHTNVARSYVTNGLNQYTQVSGQGYCYDKNGNLTLDGTNVYLYDVENRLVEMRAKANNSCASLAYTGQIKAKLRYDPMGRLHEVEGFIGGVSQGRQRFLHDGDALVAEYDAAGAMLKRYVHGPAAGADDPIAEYTGSSTAASARRNLYADARGSIVLSTTSTGATPQINTYDEYGIPGSSNTGRFQYTGQVWLPELGMNYYKARMYSPLLGRFMQTDPIGYEDNVNLYAYVANDPINGVDPTGMCGIEHQQDGCMIEYDPATSKADPETSNSLSMVRAIPETGLGNTLTFDPQNYALGTEASHGQVVSEAVNGKIAGSSLALAAKASLATGEPVPVTFITFADPNNAIGNYGIEWSGDIVATETHYEINATGTIQMQKMNWDFDGGGRNIIRDTVTLGMGAAGPQGTYFAKPNRTITGNFQGRINPANRIRP